MRPRGASFVLPGTRVYAREAESTISAGVALTQAGELFSWDGSSWTPAPPVPAMAAVNSMYSYFSLAGGGPTDLYANAWLMKFHFDGSGWNNVDIAGGVHFWARPYGSQWALAGTGR